jgi:putative ABC transport system permease protein
VYARVVRGALWRNRWRAAIALAAIIVPTALVAAVANFLLDARARMTVEMRGRGANVVVDGDRPAPPGGVTVARWARWVEDDVAVVGFAGDYAAFRTGWRVTGAWPGPGEALCGVRLAARRNLSLGAGFLGRRVTGLLETGDDDEQRLFVPLDRAAETTELGVPGSVAEVEAVAAAIPGARVVRQIADTEGGLVRRLTLVFALVAAFVLGISALSMATALSAAVIERRREIGLLKALGASDLGVMRLFAGELAVVGGLGLVAGIALGLGLSRVLSRAVFGVGADIRAGAIAVAVVACAVVAVAGSLVALRGAVRLQPARVLREE